MSRDVVVIGGGVIGATIAYELARAGATVTLLERGGDLARECSAGNAGMVSSTHAMPLASPTALMQGLRWMWRRDSPFKIRPRPQLLPWLAHFTAASTPARANRAGALLLQLTQRGLELHRELADALDTSLVRRGMIDAYETPAGVEFGRAEVSARRKLGLSGELLTTDQLLDVEPSLSRTLAGGAFYPDEAHCDPLRFAQAVGEAAAELGADIRYHVEVLGVDVLGDRVRGLQTTAGRINAGNFVLAAGVWSPPVARDLNLYLPIEGAKGYHVEVDSGAGTPSLPIYMMESKVVATPLGDRLRLSGTLELDGLDTRIDPVRVGAILNAGRRHLPAIRGSAVRDIWRGLRPCAPDGLPVIGRVDGVDNFVVATGHAMAGTTLAPITAKLVYEILENLPPSVELDLMRPNRFRRMLSRSGTATERYPI